MVTYYDQAGWAVKQVMIGIGDDWEKTTHWAVAIANPQEALLAVEKGTGATPDVTFTLAGPLSAKTMAALQMAPGQISVM